MNEQEQLHPEGGVREEDEIALLNEAEELLAAIIRDYKLEVLPESAQEILHTVFDCLTEAHGIRTVEGLTEERKRIRDEVNDPGRFKRHYVGDWSQVKEHLGMDDIGKRISARDFHDLGLQMMQVSESEDVIAVINRILSLLPQQEGKGE